MVQIAAWDGGGQRMQLGVPWCAAHSMRTVSTPASIGQLLCVLGRRGHVLFNVCWFSVIDDGG